MNARPITWPTVPKGKDRVRVCLHSGNTEAELDLLVHGVVSWAEEILKKGAKGEENEKMVVATDVLGVILESKL